MEDIASQLDKDRILYRELFINASKTFKELVKSYKDDFACNKCGVCCKIRYSKLSPEEILQLADEENDPTAREFLELFVPYADKPGHGYAGLIGLKHDEPVYFYYCKYAGSRDNCDKMPACRNFPDSITTILPAECGFRHWQKFMLNKIITEIEPDIDKKMREILAFREQFKCRRTGTCCRLACSEFSPEELRQKALDNDEFAKQFTSVFVPYTNIDEAREVYPEYVELVLSRLERGEKAYFYYCRHLRGNNTCPVYEDRPGICRDFPDNPFSIIPHSCGFYRWKEEVIVAAYTYSAMAQVYGFYSEKIKFALE